VKRSRPDRLLFLALIALVGVLSAACVRPDKPTVAINKLEANLVFGVTKPPEQVETPIQQAAVQVAQLDEVFQAFNFPDAPLPAFNNVPLISAPKVACPTAAPDAAPAKAAEVTITGPVPMGINRYKVGGFFTEASGQVPFAPDRFERRIVRRFKELSPTLTTFEVVQPVLGRPDRFVVATYEVNTAGLNRNPSNGVGVITTPGVGEPERGVSLVRMAEVDKNGRELAAFEPTFGLLLLPLPVTAGEQFQSVAVDPKSGQTITHESIVLRRQRIDACGDLVDGWLVETNRVVSRNPAATDVSSGNSSGKYSMIIAPQLGGLPVQERIIIDAGCPAGPCDISATLGQLSPDPLPPGSE
jgi:hypothetical protein